MNEMVSLLACPLCKSGLDEAQALGMEISIYLMLGLIYTIAGLIVYKIYKVMSRDRRALQSPAPAKPVLPPAESLRS